MIILIFTAVVQNSDKKEKLIQPLGFLLSTWWSDLYLQKADRIHYQWRNISSPALVLKPSLHRLKGFPNVQSSKKVAQLE